MKKLFILLFTTITLVFHGCGSNNIGESSAPASTTDIRNNSFVYLSNSSYKNVLIACINPINKEADSCSLDTLPFIAQESVVVTKELIMKRLVVSDTWMAERFSQLLNNFDGKNMKKLFGAVTAVVIHKDVRPSFYTPVTGAIYLDPRYLWLTPAEAATIKVQDDFRSDFGNALQFITGSRSTLNGVPINTYKALDSGTTRSINEIEMPFAALLYHELAHANDFAPPSIITSIDKSQTVLKAIEALKDDRISVQLYKQYRLTSSKLASLGKVLYQGHTANSQEKDLTAFVAGELFDEDRASDIYAYSSVYEDTATLFADTMMKIHYGVDNDVLFITEDSRELKWGIRNPIAKASVKPRALFASNRLSPISNGWDTKFDTLVGTYKYLHTGNSRKLLKQINVDFKHSNYFKDLPL